ncbi:nardilysin-like isoform X1 [Schistocerca piceifrons]|uniref:nardilysin-like isoform X1 n=1 Tax=Schistocerca piceifrons TaxID=274613 RepID=UPI001F5FCA16|nr:nardilysin-like isoform X1 [Schistocerca piceifrons]
MFKNVVRLKNLVPFVSRITGMSKRVANEGNGHNLPGPKMSRRDDIVAKNESSTNEICNTNGSVSQKFIVLPTPTKSENDSREYRAIKLKNGVTVLLISDVENLTTLDQEPINEDETVENQSHDESDSSSEESENGGNSSGSLSDGEGSEVESLKQEEKLAAVGLCVGVGSFSDPDEIPGLAHFLEHMVFMGSEKYPTENSFDEFIKIRGGSTNATTETETTTFYFDCHERHLSAVIDRFVQFFISPLLQREAMTREREAIDSEFQMAAPRDSVRKEQFLCSLAKEGYPARKFTWGNMKTLRDDVDDNVLYETLHAFRRRHYSAHRMTVAIQARLPMTTLEDMVCDNFLAIQCNNEPRNDFSEYVNSFDTDVFHKLYRMLPVKELIQVDLTWAFPPMLAKYRSKPHHYLSWVLGHEGKGGLFALLRKRLWATDIYCGNDESGGAENSMYSLFTISIVLTAMGYKNIDQVLNVTFGYIELLKRKGASFSIYEELKASEDMDFRFAGEVNASEYVERLVEAMHYYPPEDYLTGSELYFEYDPKAIEDCIRLMSPDTVNVLILTTDSSINFDKEEPWFKARYRCDDIPTEWIENWKNQEPHTSFDLPEPNMFLPTDFEIVEHDDPVPGAPVCIRADDWTEVWYRPDDKFNKPLTYIYCSVSSPMASISACNYVMLELFVKIFNRHVAEDLYPAEVVGMKTVITAKPRGIVIKIDGYSHKLHQLILELIARNLASYEDMLNESVCDTMLEELKKAYFNEFVKPSALNRDLRFSVLVHNYWTNLEKYTAADSVTFLKLKDFVSEMLNNLYVQVLIQGNYSEKQALDISDVLISSLPCKIPVPGNAIRARVREVAVGKFSCAVPSFNDDDTNSIVTNYYQLGPIDLKSSCLLEIIVMLMQEPLFNILRTKKQLGYDVSCSYLDTFGMLGFCISVYFQAYKFTSTHIAEEIESFLNGFMKHLKKLKLNDFEKVRDAVIVQKQCVDLQLKDEVERNWFEIASGDFLFNRWCKEIEYLQQIQFPDVIHWFERTVVSGSSRRLSIQVVGCKDARKGKQGGHKKVGNASRTLAHKQDVENVMRDITAYRENLFLHPVINIKL